MLLKKGAEISGVGFYCGQYPPKRETARKSGNEELEKQVIVNLHHITSCFIVGEKGEGLCDLLYGERLIWVE